MLVSDTDQEDYVVRNLGVLILVLVDVGLGQGA